MDNYEKQIEFIESNILFRYIISKIFLFLN
ncbi:hypothetical protein M8044_000123 [Columbia Basin potato purple top phytoplasma]|uniref:Uncharacterized protein n=1 Tax=Columbia Basin potato purple top phytoplasma TaxID=307134 RepID=A0ABT5L8B0_9MOLU|nr:hypothetical protein [Columbia Basin potato purple top phytoplasma]